MRGYWRLDEARRELADRWIAVTERLPDTGERVLTWNGEVQAVYRWVSGTMRIYSITHWRPLPASPAEEPNAD